MQKLSRQDLCDILYGCTILGTGGGGSLQRGIEQIDKALAAGKEFTLVSLEELPDEALIACPYRCGAISPKTEEELKQYADLPRMGEEPALLAFKALEEYMGLKFHATISTELGGGNTAIAFYTAAMLGIPIVDGDPAGRSVPELQHSTFYINNIRINPMAVANEFGEVAIIKDVVNDFRAEALVRAMAVVSDNSIGVADHVAKARDLREAVIPGAISYALKIGRALRKAREANEDIAAAIAKAAEGATLFRGKVHDFNWQTQDGFTLGETYLHGTGEFAGQTYKTWFKNEHIIAWRNGEIDVTVPDLICMVDDDTKEPVINPHFAVGMNIAVIGLPSPKEWRTEQGLKCFGPKHFGYDIEYVPIDKKSR